MRGATGSQAKEPRPSPKWWSTGAIDPGMGWQARALRRTRPRDHTLCLRNHISVTVQMKAPNQSLCHIILDRTGSHSAHPLLKEHEIEHFRRTEERRRRRRIESHPTVAQGSALAHQCVDNSRPDRYLPKIILTRSTVRWRTDCVASISPQRAADWGTKLLYGKLPQLFLSSVRHRTNQFFGNPYTALKSAADMAPCADPTFDSLGE